MIALVSFWIAGLGLLTAVLLSSAYGRPFAELIARSIDLQTMLYTAFLVNFAALSYLVYFIASLSQKDRIWLINIFFGWSLILGSGLALVSGFNYANDFGELGTLSFGRSWESQAITLVVGGFLAAYSSNKYKSERTGKTQ